MLDSQYIALQEIKAMIGRITFAIITFALWVLLMTNALDNISARDNYQVLFGIFEVILGCLVAIFLVKKIDSQLQKFFNDKQQISKDE